MHAIGDKRNSRFLRAYGTQLGLQEAHMPRHFVTLAILIALAASGATPVFAKSCALRCAKQIRLCIKQECNPPAFAIPKRACKLGLRAGAIAACKRSGPSACPKDRCIIAPGD